MKDHEGFLPKGWMMHEPYNLHNGTPALAIYTYLYRTTRKNEWQGTLQTLASIVEIPLSTVKRYLFYLQSRGLVYIEPLAYSHYSIKAQRLTSETPEVDQIEQVVSQNEQVVSQIDQAVVQIGQPLKDNININKNININHSGGGVKETDAPTTAATTMEGISRKDYIIKVLAHSIPEYPFSVIYEYAKIANIPFAIVDSFIVHYEQTGWKMKNGGRISNWLAALKNWQKREQRFDKENAAKTRAAKTIVSYQAGQQMSDRNREIYEQEQERKKREKEQREKESEEALTYEEFQALKERLKAQ